MTLVSVNLVLITLTPQLEMPLYVMPAPNVSSAMQFLETASLALLALNLSDRTAIPVLLAIIVRVVLHVKHATVDARLAIIPMESAALARLVLENQEPLVLHVLLKPSLQEELLPVKTALAAQLVLLLQESAQDAVLAMDSLTELVQFAQMALILLEEQEPVWHVQAIVLHA